MKKISLLLLVLMLGAAFSVPKAKALETGLSFGGYVLFSLPCTAPPFGLWIFYTPLYLGMGVPISGPLYYPPTAVPYANFAIGVPTTWELGSYVPSPGFCALGVPPFVIPLPALGTILYTGTSLPGALPI